MNVSKSSKLGIAVILLALVMSLSSCNRGYGCPYELKAPIKISFVK